MSGVRGPRANPSEAGEERRKGCRHRLLGLLMFSQLAMDARQAGKGGNHQQCVQAYVTKKRGNFVPLFRVIWRRNASAAAWSCFMMAWKELLSGFFPKKSASGRDRKIPTEKWYFSARAAQRRF